MREPRHEPAAVGGRLRGEVVENRLVGTYQSLTLGVEGWPGAQSGQFVMLQATRSTCFLPRPYSVSDETSVVHFLVDPVGQGSRELCGLQPGHQVWVLGPLGRGFAAAGALAPAAAPRRAAACPAAAAGTRRPGRLVVLAGGVGVAPMPLLLREVAGMLQAARVQRRRNDREWLQGGILLVAGFRSSREAAAVGVLEAGLDLLQREGVDTRLEVTTEDGSRGRAGLVTDAVRAELGPEDVVVACGPTAMCRAVWQLCRRRGVQRAWFSLEAVMACGVGSCHGCVITPVDGVPVRVCREGPVFTGDLVFGREEVEA